MSSPSLGTHPSSTDHTLTIWPRVPGQERTPERCILITDAVQPRSFKVLRGSDSFPTETRDSSAVGDGRRNLLLFLSLCWSHFHSSMYKMSSKYPQRSVVIVRKNNAYLLSLLLMMGFYMRRAAAGVPLLQEI